MALGVNMLFRLTRKILAEPLEDFGLLPGKYYRSQALGALEENDFPECLRYLKMAEVHRKAQSRMVAQLLILRCRMLLEEHKMRVGGVTHRLELEQDAEKSHRYREILVEEQKAVHLLERYIRSAQDLVRKPEQLDRAADQAVHPA